MSIAIGGRTIKRIGIMVALVLIAAASWLEPLDSAAEKQLDAGMKAALVTFASARALNAAISLLQSGQVSAQLGVGMSVSPGEMLDPINDLVEQFSNFMLAATVAFGIQKVLLTMGTHWGVSVALTLAAFTLAVLGIARWSKHAWLVRLFMLALLIRFAIPAVTLGTHGVFEVFLASKYEASQQSVGRMEGQAEAISQTEADDRQKGIVAAAKGWYSKGTGIAEQSEKLRKGASRLTEDLTDLMVVFLLRTMLFPLALLWMLYMAIRSLYGYGLRPGTPHPTS